MSKLENKELGINFFSFGNVRNNQPKFSSDGRQDYINYGDDNNYPSYLMDLLNGSSDHNSIVKRKTDMAVGGGFINKPELEEFIKNPFGKETLDEIVYKLGYDLMVYGSFAYLVTWSNDGETIARITYVPLNKVRIAKPLTDEKEDAERFKREEDGVEFYYISEDWSNTRKQANKPELIQGFSEDYNDVKTQLVYVSEYRPSYDYYTVPDYIASMDWIELDKEIANFHVNSVHNGFTPSMIINFNAGIPTADEQRVLGKKIKEQYAGSDNASKVFITYSETAEKKPDFIPVQLNDSDERFTMLNEQITQKIITGHRANHIIAGVAVGGKLGSSAEVEEMEELFQRTVINQKQVLIEKNLNKLVDINGIDSELELVNVTVKDVDGEIKDEDNNDNLIIE